MRLKPDYAKDLRNIALIVFFVLAGSIATLSAQTMADDTCFMCHGRKGGTVPFVEKENLAKSVHGKIRCVLCHRDAGSIPHSPKPASVACSRCHGTQSKTYLNSRHGRIASNGRTEAEVCSDCHGNAGHEILSSKQDGSPVFRSNIVSTCARCHADAERMIDVRLSEKNPVQSYKETVHGKAFEQGNTDAAVCTDCHGTHGLYNELNPESTIYKRNIPDTCGNCHTEVAGIYRESIHGTMALSGDRESPVCTDCHGGGHSIRSTKNSGDSNPIERVTQTCAVCHESEQVIRRTDLPLDRLSTYRNSYHGLAALRGDSQVANCASCHGYHDILPSENPRSSINPANLAETCGRCHRGAGDKLSLGNIHGSPESKHWSLAVVQLFYWIIIPLALGAMLLHNVLDWARKLFSGTGTVTHSDTIRFTVNERIQHWILLLTFILLALSGFALKFPDALWAQYLAPSDESVRRLLHRWAALFFTLLAVYHFVYMKFSARGRFLSRELMPQRADVTDMLSVAAYNAGIRKSRPVHNGFYRYPEKIEYWSLVWGTGVMIVSGALLVFNNFTLKYFPLWVSDLATLTHYYEAILACMAIVLWHFYGVIFDPDVYPMNCAWLNGYMHCSDKKMSPRPKKYYGKIHYGRF